MEQGIAVAETRRLRPRLWGAAWPDANGKWTGMVDEDRDAIIEMVEALPLKNAVRFFVEAEWKPQWSGEHGSVAPGSGPATLDRAGAEHGGVDTQK